MSLIRSDRIEYRQVSDSDFYFLWDLHQSELRPYIERIWGWDEDWQKGYFRDHFDPTNQRIIQYEGEDIGTVKVEEHKARIFLTYIVFSAKYQGKGLGTAIIQDVIRLAEGKKLPVRLKVLRGNPAKEIVRAAGVSGNRSL